MNGVGVENTAITGVTNTYGILGHPVHHTLSPLIHNLAFQFHTMNAVYVPFEVRPANLREAVAGACALGIRGMNVTVPHKERIVEFLPELSPVARTIGAVNTLVLNKEGWTGHNTDGIGFQMALEKWKSRIVGGDAMVIGAGGSARAVAWSLLNELGVRRLVFAARNLSPAGAIAEKFKSLVSSVSVETTSLDRREDRAYDIVVNCTPVGMDSVPGIALPGHFRFQEGSIAVDLIYEPKETLFLAKARREGAIPINGLEMLLRQAEASFELWTGLSMPLQMIRSRLSLAGLS